MKILFAGTPAFAAQHLAGIVDFGLTPMAVITQPDKPGKRGKRNLPSAVKHLAEVKQLPLLQPVKLTVHDILTYQPELIIVVAYGQILPAEVLQFPYYGCINVHASLLPKWRGAAPMQRSLEAGDTKTGICIMQMDVGLDTGDILWQASLDILPRDTTQTLSDRLVPLGLQGLIAVIEQIQAGTLCAHPQPQGGSYAKKLTKAEAHCRWYQDADCIARQIRAYHPDPGAYSLLDELRVKFHMAEAVESHQGTPGEILSVTKAGIKVACGEGAAMITQLQLPIGKGSILSAADVLNARKNLIYPGAKFQ